MGLFDFLRSKKPSAPQPLPSSPSGAPRFTVDRTRMFDLGETAQLAQLFATPADQRGDAWCDAFFDHVWNASVVMADPPEFVAPDGFRYLRLSLPRPNAPFESQSLANLAGTCVERLSGAVIFASPDDPIDAPQYVLSLGLLESLRLYDSWRGDPIDIAESTGKDDATHFTVEEEAAGLRALTVTASHEVLTGSPSPSFLSPAMARGLTAYMTNIWGIDYPHVHLLVDAKMRPSRNLVIGRKRSDFVSEEDAQSEMRRIFWFLPPLRAVILMPDHWQESDMTPLSQLSGEG